ncbi:MAG: hypothetical protein WD770_02850 [Actinomycetota bacterium]
MLALARVLWALPGTVLGLAAGFGSLAKPRRDGDALVFESTRGFAAFLNARGYNAITLGQVITSHGPLSPPVRRHEGAHVRQWTRGGVVFAVLYLLEGLRCLVLRRHPHRDNVFERRARAAEPDRVP